MLAVLEMRLVGYRHVWRGSVLSSFVLPVLFVVGFGIGVGRFVDTAGGLPGVRYLDYIAPGALATTGLQIAFGESAYQVMSRFQWIRTYHAMVATPLRVADILAGDLMFIALRVLTASTVFLGITALFGAVHSPWGLAAPVVCALLGLAVAAPMHAYTASVRNDSGFTVIQRLLVIPMSLFAGVFFPVTQLPAAARVLAYASPLWHAVELCRAATLPRYPIGPPAVAGHLAYLVLWAGSGFVLATVTFRRRLAE
ncbi:MAG TPA: ABC transporter permease [Rugosimonospora sp.]|nr:ABC transporter permease [Rugosimonospora sp.]